MNLTKRQEAFCVAYIQSGDASAAYREAGYSPNLSPKTVNEEACRLLKNPKVSARMTELRMQVAEATNITLGTHLADLLWLREMAAKSGKYAAAVQAEMARGKVIGLYVDRIAMSGGLEVTEKVDLSALSVDELRAMHALMEKAGASGHTLQ